MKNDPIDIRVKAFMAGLQTLESYTGLTLAEIRPGHYVVACMRPGPHMTLVPVYATCTRDGTIVGT